MPTRTYHLIPHTHWDREWYLTRAEFVCRLVPALDDLVAKLETDGAFRAFALDGQTVLLEDYLAVRPEMEPRLRALVATGRLQVGPWYVLADEQIPSGESLIRNLLAGSRDAADLGGRLDVLYSPDAFGHPAIWPALAAEFAISAGVLWRGVGGEPGQDGDLYRWRAPDGREILVHHLSPDGYEAGASLPPDPAALAEVWPRLKQQLVPRARSPHVAVFVGADHHAAHPAVARVRDGLAALEPDADVRVSSLAEYFTGAAEHASSATPLQGELRWSYGYTWTLQGVHATRAPLKRLHGEAELALERIAEPLAALALWRRGHDARPLLRHAWRTLLRSQFHDSIGGCTSDAVAERVTARLEDAARMAQSLARVSLDALTGNDPDAARDHPTDTRPRLVFFNPVPRPRAGIALADLTWFRRDVLVGPPGARKPRSGSAPSDTDVSGALTGLRHQVVGRYRADERLDSARHYPDQDAVDIVRVAIAAPRLSGSGLSVGGRSDPLDGVVTRRGGTLDNGIVRVELTADGLVSLLDHRTGSRHQRLLRLESEGDAGDTYSYAPPKRDAGAEAAPWTSLRPVADGPLVGAVEAHASLRGGLVRARLLLALHAGSPVLRCTIDLENESGDHRLRLRVPVGGGGDEALAGGPFGPVRRTPVRVDAGSYPRETPVATAPAQRFVAVGGAAGGLAVMAPGFFEYEHTAGGDVLVTLLRCVGQLSRDDLTTRPGHAGWPTPTPGAQCLGRERLQLALAPVNAEAALSGARLAELWEDTFDPPRAVWLRQATALDPEPIDVRLVGAGLVFSSLKPADEGDAIVFRCFNATDSEVAGRLELNVPVARVSRVRADERDGERLPAEGGSVPFLAGPRAIVTLRVEI